MLGAARMWATLNDGKTGDVSPASHDSRLDVMLLDGQWRQTLACARLFGRSSLKVGVATWTGAENVPITAFSRWCDYATELPDPRIDSNAFACELLQLLRAHPSDVLVPFHDASIDILRAHRSEIEALTTLPLAGEPALKVAIDKRKTLALAERIGIATPRRIDLDCFSDIAYALAEIGLPAVLKPDVSWVPSQHGGGERLTSSLVQNLQEAEACWQEFASRGVTASLQEWLPGQREAVTFFLAEGEMWARFAQKSYREFPPLGGASVFCESVPLLPDIVTPAERLVREMQLEGCSMVEFRRDSEGRPVLMEVNPRMGGSVSLAIRCGINFPALCYAWALGKPLSQVKSYPVGKRSRWLTGDFWNLKYAFDSTIGPETPGRLRATTRFVFDFIRRPSALDPFDIADPLPAIAEMRKYVLEPFGGRLTRVSARLSVKRARKAAGVAIMPGTPPVMPAEK